jgi:hypothetical protein
MLTGRVSLRSGARLLAMIRHHDERYGLSVTP